MEELKKKTTANNEADKEIIFSKAVKAGKRIYYLDVKKSKKNEMFLAITESKKIVSGEGSDSQVNFEKHKIFLYKEGFGKFMDGLKETIGYIEREQGPIVGETHMAGPDSLGGSTLTPDCNEIKIDIDF